MSGTLGQWIGKKEIHVHLKAILTYTFKACKHLSIEDRCLLQKLVQDNRRLCMEQLQWMDLE